MKLSPELEEKVKNEALKYLRHGRPNWDIPHTEAVVYWIKELIANEGGNEKVLVPAAWLHDIGVPQHRDGYSFDDMKQSKREVPHHEIGAKEVPKVLGRIGGFTANETTEIAKLVRGHYDKDKIDTFHQQLVIEADGLAKVDWERVTPNWDKGDCLRYLNYYNERVGKYFQTKTGKKHLQRLLEIANHYWDDK